MHAIFEFVGSQIAECELPRGKGVDLVGGTEPVEPCRIKTTGTRSRELPGVVIVTS